jgi:DNA (cytosine-5)-methyltransferase 1
MTLNFVSCFAGIGGADLGFEAAGMRCVGQVEIDPHASAVLAHHWKDTPRHDDITTAITSGWADDVRRTAGHIDVVVGGAPCQDLSVAGKRAGFDGHRSVLVLDMVALAQHVGARWIVYENVPGLLTSNGGDDMAVLLQEVAAAGYPHIEWRMVDSQHFGVAQRRRRIFLVAGAASPRGREVLTEPEGMSWHPPQGSPAGTDAARTVEAGAGTGRRGVLAERGVVQALTQGLASGGPDAAHAQAGWLVPEVDGMYWDGGQISDCLDVSMLVKGQMLPEKRRMPAVLIREAAPHV